MSSLSLEIHTYFSKHYMYISVCTMSICKIHFLVSMDKKNSKLLPKTVIKVPGWTQRNQKIKKKYYSTYTEHACECKEKILDQSITNTHVNISQLSLLYFGYSGIWKYTLLKFLDNMALVSCPHKLTMPHMYYYQISFHCTCLVMCFLSTHLISLEEMRALSELNLCWDVQACSSCRVGSLQFAEHCPIMLNWLGTALSGSTANKMGKNKVSKQNLTVWTQHCTCEQLLKTVLTFPLKFPFILVCSLL